MSEQNEAVIQRAQMLVAQRRHQDAIGFLKNHLSAHPNDYGAMMLLANVLILNEDFDEAKKLLFHLNEMAPNEPVILEMMAELDIQNEFYESAEEKLEMLIRENPEDEGLFVMMARLKFSQRNYDKALYFADMALQIDPEHLSALNIKLMTSSMLGQSALSDQTLREALHQDPNHPGTLSNKAMHELRQGNTQAALEQAREALSRDPNNELAQYVMTEAMKSKFWPYKMMFKFHQKMAMMTSTQSWGIIIGGYILLRLLSRAAEKNESLQVYLYPIIFLIVSFFLATWILNPLMNAFLLTNKYGRFLLDMDEKRMAKYTITTIVVSILSLILFAVSANSVFLLSAMLFFFFTIPLGSFLNAPKRKQQQQLTFLTLAIVVTGVLGLILIGTTGNSILLLVSGLGIFAYQWIFNAVMIKAGARVRD